MSVIADILQHSVTMWSTLYFSVHFYCTGCKSFSQGYCVMTTTSFIVWRSEEFDRQIANGQNRKPMDKHMHAESKCAWAVAVLAWDFQPSLASIFRCKCGCHILRLLRIWICAISSSLFWLSSLCSQLFQTLGDTQCTQWLHLTSSVKLLFQTESQPHTLKNEHCLHCGKVQY